jgi:hypothetical protein
MKPYCKIDSVLQNGAYTKNCVPPLKAAEGYYNNGDDTKLN